MDMRTCVTRELMQDLFTVTYPTFATPGMGWQTGPPHGLQFPMQYSTPLVPLTYSIK